ncbi:hypothetical protein GCM10010441_37220 [Kitasatospora paracochleata]|uniref:Uncharacterized protein n=1 Tax=Kitasatospora paracochleata TaxID=58354 RepID=A0ABT1J765_9ACTN|nr:hypothetical protein [Kitasatospora paracochleata]MCP2313283.1 hypothetical protein [Kitasatospora paracochleata]
MPDPAPTPAEPEPATTPEAQQSAAEPTPAEPAPAEPTIVEATVAEPTTAEPTVADPADLVAPAVDPLLLTPTGPRKASRGTRRALVVAGLLAVTAASATVTVAVGKPESAPRAVAAAPASASPTASASPSESATPTPTPTPTPTAAPKPTSTLSGSVSGGKHSGDLRYFLLPVPDQADPYGSPDGTDMTMDDIAAQYSKDTDIKGVLDSWGFEGASTRTYRTRDGKVEVTTELKKFGRADRAKGFAQNSSFKGDSFDVDGVDGAKGWAFKPEQQAYTGEMVGVGYQGDVVFEIRVSVKGDPDRALLADAMKRQRDRLANG